MKYILYNTDLEKKLTSVDENGAASINRWTTHYSPDTPPLSFDSVEQAEKLARALGSLGMYLVVRPEYSMTLILVRGLPGSGKSTYVKTTYPEIFHVEADMFCMVNNKYEFDGGKLAQHHALCRSMTELALMEGADVIVSNTFTTRSELEPYIALGNKYNANIKIKTLVNEFKSVHNVPREVIAKMKKRWEDVENETIVVMSREIKK